MKYAWLIWFLVTFYGFTPATFKTLWTERTDSDLIIIGQSCGCPCPEARIIGGHISIPEKILNDYPNIHQDELTLTGNSPYKPYNMEIGYSEILITGEVIGIDTILCSPSDCELAPKFEVDEWMLTGYSLRLFTWNEIALKSYLFGVPLGFFVLLVLTGVRKLKK